MVDIQFPNVPEEHPDRHVWCEFALHAAFDELARHAIAAGWGEREVAAALVSLADKHMLGLISTHELEAIFEATKNT